MPPAFNLSQDQTLQFDKQRSLKLNFSLSDPILARRKSPNLTDIHAEYGFLEQNPA